MNLGNGFKTYGDFQFHTDRHSGICGDLNHVFGRDVFGENKGQAENVWNVDRMGPILHWGGGTDGDRHHPC